MDIVGLEPPQIDESAVHTIDIWYSRRRNCWMIERLNGEGHPVGAAHRCASQDEAEACLAEWLRAHNETFLAAPRAVGGGGGDACGRPAQATDGANKVIRLADRSRAA